jgi:hypothetical protein
LFVAILEFDAQGKLTGTIASVLCRLQSLRMPKVGFSHQLRADDGNPEIIPRVADDMDEMAHPALLLDQRQQAISGVYINYGS